MIKNKVYITASTFLYIKIQKAWIHFGQDADVLYHSVAYKHFWSCRGARTALLELLMCYSLGCSCATRIAHVLLRGLLWWLVWWLCTVKPAADCFDFKSVFTPPVFTLKFLFLEWSLNYCYRLFSRPKTKSGQFVICFDLFQCQRKLVETWSTSSLWLLFVLICISFCVFSNLKFIPSLHLVWTVIMLGMKLMGM